LIITINLNFAEWVQVFGDAKRPWPYWIGLLIIVKSWKLATIPIDLNNGKKAVKTQ
jgi:hypothetical protein